MSYWYAIQTIGGKEQGSREKIEKEYPGVTTLLPKRELYIRRRGKTRLEVKPLFAGYFFISTDKPLTVEKAAQMTSSGRYLGHQRGIVRIINNVIQSDTTADSYIEQVNKEEMQAILELTGKSEIISTSKFLKEGKTITIVSGPLEGKEVIIKKVNPRKKRITIEFSFMGEVRTFDVAGEMIKE